MNIYKKISNDHNLLEKARTLAKSYSTSHISQNTVGIVFLGAIVRGYFDSESDIDISFFVKNADIPLFTNTENIDGLNIHYFIADINNEKRIEWDMGKRWAFSQIEYFFDPQNEVKSLLDQKVPYQNQEMEWLIKSGITLSEWYINRLTTLWINRGSILSAHYMFNEGINHYFNCIFALNNQLVPDFKWRLFCIEMLERLPLDFIQIFSEIILCKEITVIDLKRRVDSFMKIWKETKYLVEEKIGLKYEDFKNQI